MTIDEFMQDIAPKMKKGFIFYDWMGNWRFCVERPIWNDENEWWMMHDDGACSFSLIMFNIQYDYGGGENSLREVGN